MIPDSPRICLAVAVAAMAIIAYCDAHTNDQISLWFLYIGPVSLVSWKFDFFEGFFCACAAGVLLAVSAIFSGHPYSTNSFFLLATLCHTGALLTIAWYAARLAAIQSILKKIVQPLSYSRRPRSAA